MANYTFYIDKLVSVWERTLYSVEAETIDDAYAIMRQEFEDREEGDHPAFVEYSTLNDTMEELTPDKNLNDYTQELIYVGPAGAEVQVVTNKPYPDQ